MLRAAIMRTALIFGASGQDGHYLGNLLTLKGLAVVGVSRSRGEWLQGDVGDYEFVEKIVQEYHRQYIFHLAADSTTRHESLFRNHTAISTGALNILESVKKHVPNAKIFLAGSAMQFENHGRPIDEATPFAASSPYAVARIHATYAGRYYRNTFGLRVYVAFCLTMIVPCGRSGMSIRK